MYKDELYFASGYYHIGARGIVSFDDDTPPEIIDRFWKVWPSYRKKVIELQEKGIFTSRYPLLPFEEPEENKKHYSNVGNV